MCKSIHLQAACLHFMALLCIQLDYVVVFGHFFCLECVVSLKLWIEYKAGAEQDNADALSRLPRHSLPSSVPTPPETVYLMEHLASTPVTVSQIRVHTNRDHLLLKVRKFIRQGWPERVEDESTDIQPYE